MSELEAVIEGDLIGRVRINKAGRLSASLLLRALAHGHMTFFEWGMAELAGVPDTLNRTPHV